MMLALSQGGVAIVVACIAAIPATGALVVSLRAQRRGEKMEEKAAVFEGYDELVTHLRGRVNEMESITKDLQQQLADWRKAAERCQQDCVECRKHLAEAERLVRDLRAELDELGRQGQIDRRFHSE